MEELRKQIRFNRKTLQHLNDNYENLTSQHTLLIPLPTELAVKQRLTKIDKNVTVIAAVQSNIANNEQLTQIQESESNPKQKQGRDRSRVNSFDVAPKHVRVNNNNTVSSSGFNKNQNQTSASSTMPLSKVLYPSFRALRQHKLRQLQKYHQVDNVPRGSHNEKKNIRQSTSIARKSSYSTHSKSIYSVHKKRGSYSSQNNHKMVKKNPSKRKLPSIYKDVKVPKPPKKYDKSRSEGDNLKHLKFDRFSHVKNNGKNHDQNRSHHALRSEIKKPSKHINMFARHKKSIYAGYPPNKENKNNENEKPKFELSAVKSNQQQNGPQQSMQSKQPINSKLRALNKQKQKEKRLRNAYK